MRIPRHLSHLSALTLASCALLAGVHSALAGPPPPQATTNHGAIADGDLTLVVGTRFVSPSTNGMSPKAQFTDARIPLSGFNDTDHCIDRHALELAMEYFNNLGPILGEAGHYHFVPDDQIERSASMCEKLHGAPPKVWDNAATKIIAFGRIVPTSDAAALEKAIR